MNLNVLLLLVAVGLVKGSRAPRVDDSREAVLTFLGIDSTNLQINDLPTFLNAPLPPMGIHNLSAQDISFVIEEYLRQSFFEKASITFNPKSYLEQATLIFISRSALISQKELVIKHPAYLQKFLPRLYHISSISARECVRILAEIEDETFPDMLQWFWAESREEEAMDALVTEWRKLSGPIDPNEPAVKSRELLFKRTSRLQVSLQTRVMRPPKKKKGKK